MASDSDVEAYLHQLSRKTFSLKQGGQPWDQLQSSIADELSDEQSESSGNHLHIKSEKPTNPLQERGAAGSLSDIAALAEKYSAVRKKKSNVQDKFSNLEKKYLRKQSFSRDVESPKLLKEASNTIISPQSNPQKTKLKDRTNAESKLDISLAKIKSDLEYEDNSQKVKETFLVDEDLAHNLHKVSLAYESQDSDDNSTVNTTATDSLGEVINLQNVLSVDDLIGKVTENNSNISSTQNSGEEQKNNVLETGVNIQSHDEVRIMKGNKISDNLTGNMPWYPKQQMGGIREKNIAPTPEASKFYSNKQNEDDNHLPGGLLVTEAGKNVFHSSQRKSSVEFNVKSKRQTKSKSSNHSHTKKSKPKTKSMSEDSVAEDLVSVTASSITELVPASGHGGASFAPEEDASEQTQENIAFSELEGSSHSVTSEYTDKKKSKSLHVYSQSNSANSDALSEEKIHKKHTKYPNTKANRPVHRGKSHKQKLSSDYRKNSGQNKSHEDDKQAKKHSHYRRKKHSSSSISESPSDFEPVRCRAWSHRRNRKRIFGHWDECPIPGPGCWSCCGHHAHITSAGTCPHVQTISSSVGLSGGLTVEEIMKQQVALIRQFLDSQQVMYHAYTSALASSHHYTSLHNTEKYIKKRKPPLTFNEAYRQVKEEVESSPR